MPLKVLLISRCAWTLFNFRSGLMRLLMDSGHQVVCAGAEDGFEERIRAMGIPFRPLPVDKKGVNPKADLKLFFAIVKLVRQERPDVVHNFTIKPVIYGGPAAWLARAPRVLNTVTGLGYVFSRGKTTPLQLLVEGMYRPSLALARKTFFLNPEDRDFFLSRGIIRESKAGLLPGEGLDCGRFSPREGESGPPVVLMVARLLKDKGVYEFVEAARIVKKEFPEASFELLGARDTRNPTAVSEEEVRAWEEEGAVTWLGETDDVRPHIARARMVVLPSYREGLPRSVLEASAMERPVVATDVTGCRDAVEQGTTGLLVPPRDSRSLAKAIATLLGDPETCGRMGRAGREMVLRLFDEAAVNQKILENYTLD